MATSIPHIVLHRDLNNNTSSQQNKRTHNITASCTSTFEDGRKMKGSAAKIDCTTEFLTMSSVKSAVNLSNSDTVKLWAFRNLEDSLKDSSPLADWRSPTQMKNLISPSRSLQNSEKNEYKVDHIPTLWKFSLQGNLKIPQDSLLQGTCNFAAEMVNLISPSCSLWNFVKNDYKLDSILTMWNFTSRGKFSKFRVPPLFSWARFHLLELSWFCCLALWVPLHSSFHRCLPLVEWKSKTYI